MNRVLGLILKSVSHLGLVSYKAKFYKWTPRSEFDFEEGQSRSELINKRAVN